MSTNVSKTGTEIFAKLSPQPRHRLRRLTSRGFLLRRVQSFLADRCGSIGVIFGLALPAMIGFAGLAIDTGQWYQQRAQLQTAADAAAVAGAHELAAGQGATRIHQVATSNAASNGFSGATVQTSTRGATASATLTTSAPLYFSQLFLTSPVQLSASASATYTTFQTCILALSPSTRLAVSGNGNGNLTANGCAIYVNSTATPAIGTSVSDVAANAIFNASGICVGGTSGTGTFSITPIIGCPPQSDPLAGLPAPTVGSCTATNYNVTRTPAAPLSPGVYCGGITASGSTSLTFQPGTYILKDGGLTLTGQASVTGTGVFFYLTGTNPIISMASTTSAHFSAPTTGAYAGILFFADRTLPNLTYRFNGGDAGYFEGTAYLPTISVVLTGDGCQSGNAPWTVYIAYTLMLSGNGSVSVNSNYGNSQVPVPAGLTRTIVRLSA